MFKNKLPKAVIINLGVNMNNRVYISTRLAFPDCRNFWSAGLRHSGYIQAVIFLLMKTMIAALGSLKTFGGNVYR